MSCAVVMGLFGCASAPGSPPVANIAPPTEVATRPPRVTELGTGMRDSDLDGDGVPDPILADFTGGAHCCYTLMVELSRQLRHHEFPFELDGGYVYGLDLSQPDQFYIADYDDDGVADLCAEIQTYNGEPEPIPQEWTKKYGIRRNWIIISFVGAQPTVRDLRGRTCDPNVLNRGV